MVHETTSVDRYSSQEDDLDNVLDPERRSLGFFRAGLIWLILDPLFRSVLIRRFALHAKRYKMETGSRAMMPSLDSRPRRGRLGIEANVSLLKVYISSLARPKGWRTSYQRVVRCPKWLIDSKQWSQIILFIELMTTVCVKTTVMHEIIEKLCVLVLHVQCSNQDGSTVQELSYSNY